MLSGTDSFLLEFIVANCICLADIKKRSSLDVPKTESIFFLLQVFLFFFRQSGLKGK